MMPTLERFKPRDVEPKPWGREILIASSADWTMKRLEMNAGHRGGLQYHERKHEAFYLQSGTAIVRFDAGNGLIERRMHAGETYQVPPKAVHQVEAVTDCVFYEVSNPVLGDRVNVGEHYGVGKQGEAW